MNKPEQQSQSKTPRTDEAICSYSSGIGIAILFDACRQLETELGEAREQFNNALIENAELKKAIQDAIDYCESDIMYIDADIFAVNKILRGTRKKERKKGNKLK